MRSCLGVGVWVGLLWTATVSAGSDDLSAWTYETRIDFTTDVAGALTNFPALVVLNEQVHGFRYAQYGSPAGADLRFTDAGGTALLNHEIESWNTNGDSYVWVQIPVYSNGAMIAMHWGHPQISAPAFSATGAAWSNGYEAVFHLDDDALSDSAAHGFDGVNAGSTGGPGIIGGGRFFSKASGHYINAGPGLNVSNRSFSLSAWARRGLTGASAEGYLIAHGQMGPPNRRGLHFGFRGGSDADHPGLGFWADDVNAPATYPDTNQWYQWDATYNAVTREQKIYVNGIHITTRVAGENYQGSPTADLRIGSRFDGVAYDGGIDEVRISSLERSSNWIRAAYLIAASNAASVRFGPIDGGPPPYISNEGGATSVTPHTAQLGGELVTTGQAPAMVYLYFGELDGGHSKTAWAQRVSLGVRPKGLLQAGVSGLKPGERYLYRLYATNTYGEHWAATSSEFRTLSAQVAPQKFARRMEIRFDGYTRSETLSNFPLLVRLHEGLENFRYGDFASPSGGDLRFAGPDGLTELRYEIDRWVTNGVSLVWVQVPALSAGGRVYAYWGRPGATAAPAYTTNGDVWSAEYRTVLHLNTNLLPATFLDSSGNGLFATNFGSFDDAGVIGRARVFNHAADHHLRCQPGINISNRSFSTSAWARRFTTNTVDYLLSHGTAGASSIGLHFGFIGASTLRFSFWADDLDVADVAFGDTAGWHLWSASFDAATKRQAIYRDGVEIGSRIAFNPYLGSTSTPLRAGVAHADAGTYFDGWIDEVRVSSAARSSNWVWACWANQKTDSTFLTILPAGRSWEVLPDLEPAGFSRRARIQFDGYTKGETLYNFPALVALGPHIDGFRYSSFDSAEGADIRFTDAGGVRELSFEIERWNTGGASYVWTRVPAMQPGTAIYAYWGRLSPAQPPTLGLKLWLKAGEGVQTNAGGGVLLWSDASGQGNDVAQTLPGEMPQVAAVAINGQPAIRFDGGDRLFAPQPSLPERADPRAVIVVTRSAAVAGDAYVFSYGNAAQNESFALDVGDDVRIVGFNNDHDTGFDGDAAVRMFSIAYDGGTVEPQRDGQSGAPGARVYDTAATNLSIGSFTDGGFRFDGDVAEVLVYDRELTPGEMTELGNYLAQKYNLSTPYSARAHQSVDGSTWAQDFRTVLHLDHDVLDSTPFRFNATNFGAFEASGQVSRALRFDKALSDHLQGAPGIDLANRSFSLSAWARRSTAGAAGDGFFLSHGDPGVNQRGLHFGFRGGADADTITFAFWGDDLNFYDPVNADTTDWHLWTATYDTSTRRQALYRDGVEMAARTAASNYQGSANSIIRIGEIFGTSYYDGALDELRLSAAERSSNWIWACWFNQRNPTAFATYHPAGIVDRDDDGLPDQWELQYRGGPTQMNPTGDDDKDDFDNEAEYIADTVPTDFNSHLRVTRIDHGPPFYVYFDASTARVYRLQYTDDLFATAWSNVSLQATPGLGDDSYLVDPGPASTRRYRLNVGIAE